MYSEYRRKGGRKQIKVLWKESPEKDILKAFTIPLVAIKFFLVLSNLIMMNLSEIFFVSYTLASFSPVGLELLSNLEACKHCFLVSLYALSSIRHLQLFHSSLIILKLPCILFFFFV
jgi:hypothetical protein